MRGIGAMSILGAIPRAIDLQGIEKNYGDVGFVTGFGYMSGQLTREQVINTVTCPSGMCL